MCCAGLLARRLIWEPHFNHTYGRSGRRDATCSIIRSRVDVDADGGGVLEHGLGLLTGGVSPELIFEYSTLGAELICRNCVCAFPWSAFCVLADIGDGVFFLV